MDEQIKFQFFRHSINTRQDEKVKALYRKEGWQGYGLFWALLEYLVANGCKAKCDYEDISWDLRIDEDIIKRIVENYGLFKIKNGYFWSDSLLAQIEEVTERYKRRSAAGKQGAKRKAELRLNNNNEQVMLDNDASNASSNATAMLPNSASNKEDKEDKRDKEDKKDTRDSLSPSSEAENNHGVGDNTPTQQFVLEKKKNFIMVAMTCEGDYPKQLRKSFADYWTQPLQADPSRMLFEEKRAFDIPTMLRRWAETEHPGKRAASAASGKTEEVISFDQYYRRYGTTLCQDGWQIRRNEKKNCMEYYRKIEEE